MARTCCEPTRYSAQPYPAVSVAIEFIDATENVADVFSQRCATLKRKDKGWRSFGHVGYCLSLVSLRSLNHGVEMMLRKGYIGTKLFGLIKMMGGQWCAREREEKGKRRGREGERRERWWVDVAN